MDARNDFSFIFENIFGNKINVGCYEEHLDDLWSRHVVDSYYKEFFTLQGLGYKITRDSDGKHTVVKI